MPRHDEDEVKIGKMYTNGKRVVMLVVDTPNVGAMHPKKRMVVALKVKPFDLEDFQYRSHHLYGQHRSLVSMKMKPIPYGVFHRRYPYEVDGVEVD